MDQMFIGANVPNLSADQEGIAKCFGWPTQALTKNCREMIAYIDKQFYGDNRRNEIAKTILDSPMEIEEGMPFYAMANQFTLFVTRKYVDNHPVYASDYSTLQASEDYQYTLQKMIHNMTKSRKAIVYVRVTDYPKKFDIGEQSIITNSSAECDIFLPTGISKGLSSRNGQHLKDSDVFATIIKDYAKIMRKLQRKGYELTTHFYLVRASDMSEIRKDPIAAKKLWDAGKFRDYREISIAKDGEVQMRWREELEAKIG